jgi:dethiobiotin synthetase
MDKPPLDHAYFITATGTDIGKTFVTSLLLRYAFDRDRLARALKPVMSGVTEPQQSDAAYLLRAMNQEVTTESIHSISPWQFAAPLSPHRAAVLEGKALDIREIIGFCSTWLKSYPDALRLIEGVGGVMTPLTEEATNLDLMQELGLPIILVTGDYLGTFSHTLTALRCLESTSLRVRAVVVNESEQSVEHAETLHTLRNYAPYGTEIISLRRDSALNPAEFFAFADSL